MTLYSMLERVGVKIPLAESAVREAVPEMFQGSHVIRLDSIFDRFGVQTSNPRPMPKEPIPVSGYADAGIMRPLTLRIAGLGEVQIDKINPRFIDKMLLNPVVSFACALKISPLIDKWRDRKTWVYRASTPELAEKAKMGLHRFLYHSIAPFTTSYQYGASWNEVVWQARTAGELGCDPNIVKPADRVWTPDPVTAINPHSIAGIHYTKATPLVPRKFNGFSTIRTDGQLVTIDIERALVITHNKKYAGRIEGLTGLLSVIPYVHMYEMVLKSAMQYYDRMGVPLAIVYYPSNETVIDEKTGKKYKAYEWALKLAEDATKYTALAIPSDTSLFTDEKAVQKWRIEFPFQANNQSAGVVFETAIRQLEQMILRGIIVADRVGTQNEEYGSYALAEVHQQVTDQHTQTILYEMMAQVENYLFPKFVFHNTGAKTQFLTLDMPRITEDLKPIQNIFGNLVQTHEDSGQIDLLTMADRLNIPVQDDDAYQARQLQRADIDRQVADITTPPELMQPQGTAQDPAAKPAAGSKVAKKEVKPTPAAKPTASKTPTKPAAKPAAKK